MGISLRGLEEILHLFPFQFLKACQTLCPRLGGSFPIENFCGKMLIDLNQKILWESVKAFDKCKAA